MVEGPRASLPIVRPTVDGEARTHREATMCGGQEWWGRRYDGGVVRAGTVVCWVAVGGGTEMGGSVGRTRSPTTGCWR